MSVSFQDTSTSPRAPGAWKQGLLFTPNHRLADWQREAYSHRGRVRCQ